MKSSCLAGAAFALALVPFSLQAATPQIVPLSPSSGSGLTKTFTLAAFDPEGPSDIGSMNLLMNTSLNGADGCWIYYDHVHRVANLYSDDGRWGAIQNSRCSVAVVSGSDSASDAIVSLNVTFSASWQGPRRIWAAATDLAGDSDGYRQVGTFTVISNGPPQDFSVSLTPSNRSTTPGNSATYNFALTSLNGYSGIVRFSAGAKPQTSGITVTDSGGGTYPVEAYETVSGTMTVSSTAAVPPSNITVTATFEDNTLRHSYSVIFTLAHPSAPALSFSPVSGSGPTQTFRISVTDPGGPAAVNVINFLVNSSFSGTNGCWLFLGSPNDLSVDQDTFVALASDDGTNWSNSAQVSKFQTSTDPIHNSQCSVFGGPTIVSDDGATLTFTVTLTFTPAFNGRKLLYVRAADSSGQDTGYQQLGVWTVSGTSLAPDFSVAVSPGSQTVSGASTARYLVTTRAVNGYTGNVDISLSGYPVDSVLSYGVNYSVFFIQPLASAPPGAYTLTVTGSDGIRTHTATAVLNVKAAPVPTFAVVPDAGSGSSRIFTFIAFGQGGDSNPKSLDILFNDSVDGRHACWIYADDSTVTLASDDATIWTPVDWGTFGNSQCSISGTTTTRTSDSFIVTTQISFSRGFSGTKNIYLHTANDEGGDTGYQPQGTWTVQ
ncbi:MAG TPA: hypothetical protein VHC90_23900 [Bryobacteraceae bacterium]|nr:hypothetical protein [Bryobacteraceae bacterium]